MSPEALHPELPLKQSFTDHLRRIIVNRIDAVGFLIAPKGPGGLSLHTKDDKIGELLRVDLLRGKVTLRDDSGEFTVPASQAADLNQIV